MNLIKINLLKCGERCEVPKWNDHVREIMRFFGLRSRNNGDKCIHPARSLTCLTGTLSHQIDTVGEGQLKFFVLLSLPNWGGKNFSTSLRMLEIQGGVLTRKGKSNCHSELTRKLVELTKRNFLFLLGDSASI